MATIDAYPDGHFDVVAIDGRERIGCLLHGINKLRAGGRMVLDDSDRPRYATAFSLLGSWPRRRFRLLGHETTVFVKPEESIASGGRQHRSRVKPRTGEGGS